MDELSLLASLPQGLSNCGETITSLPVRQCEKKTGRSLSAPLATFPSKRCHRVTLQSELWVTLTTEINVLPVFCSLETLLPSWTNPLKQPSVKTHKWQKQKRVLWHSLRVQRTARGLLFQEVFKESRDPGVVTTSHKPVVFNVDNTAWFHRSLSKHCPACDLYCKPRQSSTCLG